MKHFLGLFIFVIINVFALQAQNNLPPAYEIKADTSAYFEVPDKNWQILEDPSGKLTIDQVSSPAFDKKFHINNTRSKGYNYKITNYWLRYTFKNTLNRPVKLAIDETVAEAFLYTRKPDGTWKVELNGSTVPMEKRAGLKRYQYFVATIAPGQQITFYEKDIFDFWLNKPKSFIMHAGFADAVIQKNYIDNDKSFSSIALNAIVFGILALAALINLMFYRIVKERVYLYFSLFLISFGIYGFNQSAWILFTHHVYLNTALGYISIIGFFFFIMHFIRKYLSTDVYTPKWDKFLIFLSWLLALTWLSVMFLPTTLNYDTYNAITVLDTGIIYIYYPIILGTSLYYIRKNKAAKLGIIALLPFMVWIGIGYAYLAISGLMYTQYQMPYSALYKWMNEWDTVIMLVNMVWMVIVFSWILFRRYQHLQQSLVQSSLEREIERGQLIEKQNAELEQLVAARTAELSTANRELSENQEEITAQRDQLSETVNELKTTQQQLIQSEKLASLGELTAGIAHEIQNPLNFINNFSEVNTELIDEMQEEMDKGDLEEVKAIASNIKDNQQKINHHGKRADAIVKNMLQHSRNNSAEKQLTDLNALADEYLRLSYHGLRAKDKSFNSNMATDFDAAVPKVDVIAQDIGRVLLNLYNNAFYAVQQKQKTGGADYRPEVKVATIFADKTVQIKVRDNGVGIPAHIREKILQPFFTTKPTGEGTGLGLSLSYDIVVKGHGGKIEIFSQEGEYTEFVVSLFV